MRIPNYDPSGRHLALAETKHISNYPLSSTLRSKSWNLDEDPHPSGTTKDLEDPQQPCREGRLQPRRPCRTLGQQQQLEMSRGRSIGCSRRSNCWQGVSMMTGLYFQQQFLGASVSFGQGYTVSRQSFLESWLQMRQREHRKQSIAAASSENARVHVRSPAQGWSLFLPSVRFFSRIGVKRLLRRDSHSKRTPQLKKINKKQLLDNRSPSENYLR